MANTATDIPTPKTSETDAVQVSSSDIVIKCIGLTKLFRDFWMRNRVRAVDTLDLDVRRGEVFGLLGPNGSGKSTTIKMLLGLLQPTAGRAMVFGKRPDDVATKKLIGYLPEESYLYQFLNARETLDYYGSLFYQNSAQRRQRTDMLLEMVGLSAVQRRPLREYSKGMLRRIGLAQGLINDPQLLMLDEPTTGLDPIGTKQIKSLILELARRGKTVLLCSHLLADVEDVCDRVAIMYGGKLIEQGTLDELLTQTQTTNIQLPRLDEQTIQRIEELLAKQGKHIEKVTHPRQILEDKFLDLVKREQAKGTLTSGAVSGGRIAQFLTDSTADVSVRGAHFSESVDAADVISRLVGEPTHESKFEAGQTALTAGQPGSAQPDDAAQEVIDNLVEDPKSVSHSSTETPSFVEPAAESAEQPDQEVIDSLLHDRKHRPGAGSP